MTSAKLARGVIAGTFLLTLLTGCVTWEGTVAAPQTVVAEQRPSSVRLTLGSGGFATLERPIVRNDSIVPGRGGSLGVASVDVVAIEVRRFSVTRTIGLIAAGAAAAGAWTVAVAGSGGSEGDSPTVPKVVASSAVRVLMWLGSVLVGAGGA